MARERESPPFLCPLCGSDAYVEVNVKRPSGEWYRTAFYKCFGCSVLFHNRWLSASRGAACEIRARWAARIGRGRTPSVKANQSRRNVALKAGSHRTGSCRYATLDVRGRVLARYTREGDGEITIN
jgi:hypothetical protein